MRCEILPGYWRKVYALLPVMALHLAGMACQCPPTALSKEETAKYEIIFRGTVKTVKACGSTYGEAVFRVDELYKGNSTALFKVLFECKDDCAIGFREEEEWIIYSRYKQIDNAMMDWCSRSRKLFTHEQEDFYKVNYGVDYFDEVNFLRSSLGLHRLLTSKQNAAGNRNKLPDTKDLVITLLASLAGIVVFYILFRRWFR